MSSEFFGHYSLAVNSWVVSQNEGLFSKIVRKCDSEEEANKLADELNKKGSDDGGEVG